MPYNPYYSSSKRPPPNPQILALIQQAMEMGYGNPYGETPSGGLPVSAGDAHQGPGTQIQLGAPDMSNVYGTNTEGANGLPAASNSGDGRWAGQAAAGIGAGIGGYAQGVGATQNFSVDPWAGYKGSGQGLMSGGVVGAIAGGIGSQIGTFSQVNKNLNDIQPLESFVRRDALGRPVYGGDAYRQGKNTINELNKGEKSITGSLDPATRVFSGLFGTRRKIRDAREKMRQQITEGQKAYNKASESFDKEQAAISDYRRRRNMTNRLYNLYTIPQTIGY